MVTLKRFNSVSDNMTTLQAVIEQRDLLLKQVALESAGGGEHARELDCLTSALTLGTSRSKASTPSKPGVNRSRRYNTTSVLSPFDAAI